MVPRVPPAEVARFLFAADVLVFPPTAAALRAGRTVLPMKTFQYLAAGRAILAPDLPDLREVLRHDANAVLVPPDVPGAAADALRGLLGDVPRRERLAAAALADAARYTWDARAAKIAAFLRGRLGLA
jgi:glycosyltransferase involved in cell wall biosynthesis